MKLIELFHFAAPNYDPAFMLDHLFSKFSHTESEKLNIMISEFVKFMYLLSKYNFQFIPLTGEVDEIWHAFILQTKEYECFCFSLPNASFIHHSTMHLDEFAQEKNRKAVTQELLAWLPHYFKHFGVFTNETAPYWLMTSFLQKKLSYSLEQINQLASSGHS